MDLHFDTLDGSISLEGYVARVTTAENGQAASAALRAQAIAARTFVLRAMRDDPNLGTHKKPIPNSERFQVYARTASARATAAAIETANLVCRYRGELVLCNFVAGALWTDAGASGTDPTHTEKWVTYNDGKTGADVRPTPLSNTHRTDNRGCMSQNGADWLARHGHDHPAILRFFYGADLEIGPFEGPTPRPLTPQPAEPLAAGQTAPGSTPSSSSSPLGVLAALALTLFGDNTP